MSIGERIRKRRRDLNLTQIKLAERLGLTSKAAISTVENDKESLTTERVSKYADALETTMAYLMGWTDDPSIPEDERENEPEVVYFDVQAEADGVTYTARSNHADLDAEYQMLTIIYHALTKENRKKIVGIMQQMLMEQKGMVEG